MLPTVPGLDSDRSGQALMLGKLLHLNDSDSTPVKWA